MQFLRKFNILELMAKLIWIKDMKEFKNSKMMIMSEWLY